MTIGKFADLIEAGPCWSDSGSPLNGGDPADLSCLRDDCTSTGSELIKIVVAALRDDGFWEDAVPENNGAAVVSHTEFQSSEQASFHLSGM